MKLKDPLVIVLASQMVVLVAAVAFMAIQAGRANAAVKKHAKVAAEEGEPEAPHVRLTPPPVPRPHEANGGEWADFPTGEKPAAPVKTEAHAAKKPVDPQPPAPTKHEAPAPPPAKEAKAPSTFEDVVSGLVAGNARFVEGATRQRDVVALRESLGAEEHADAVVVACTDSRVVPELLFDQPLGSFSVVRVPGAQLDDPSVKAVEDAVTRLHAKVVLVVGHLGCHHVDQALTRAGKKKGVARPVTLTNALGGLKTALEGEALEDAAVVTSVSFATRELRRRSKVIARNNELPVLRLIYAPKTGAVRWLDAEQEAPPEPSTPRIGRR